MLSLHSDVRKVYISFGKLKKFLSNSKASRSCSSGCRSTAVERQPPPPPCLVVHGRHRSNPEKTEVIWFEQKANLAKREADELSHRLGSVVIQRSPTIRDLGVWLESEHKIAHALPHINVSINLIFSYFSIPSASSNCASIDHAATRLLIRDLFIVPRCSPDFRIHDTFDGFSMPRCQPWSLWPCDRTHHGAAPAAYQTVH